MSAPRKTPPPLAGEGREGAAPQGVPLDDAPVNPTWRVGPDARTRARALRQNSTDAERRIWAALRAHRMKGASFRRQAPIGPYIVDFVCHAAKLVIELDGGQHFEARHLASDARRDAFLAREGFRVLRFNNYDVMTNREGVLETIAGALGEAPSLPSPASGRGGASGGSRA
jgi:very-short-patch-repair endonuclease